MSSPSPSPPPPPVVVASPASSSPFQIFLIAPGPKRGKLRGRRLILDLSETDTVQDLFRMASDGFRTSTSRWGADAVIIRAPILEMNYCAERSITGVPQYEGLDRSSLAVARSVLQRGGRIMMVFGKEVIDVDESRKRPASIAAADIAFNSKMPRLDNASVEAAAPSNNNKQRPLTVLSWNIAECQPSYDSTDGGTFDVDANISQECVRHDAHILCLQECPSANWKPIELLEMQYQLVGAVPSHCGFVQLWIRQDASKGDGDYFYQRLPLPMPKNQLPTVAAIILLNNHSIVVSSSHLAPFKDNAHVRLQQMEALLAATVRITPHAIHAGDFNMRLAEDRFMEYSKMECRKPKTARQQRLYDSWKMAGSVKRQEYTWNSIDNKFHANGFGFKCRFDRLYLSKAMAMACQEQQDIEFRLEANQRKQCTPSKKFPTKFYMSDHYAILCTVQVPAADEDDESESEPSAAAKNDSD
mmetsp:Transcript_3006/g.4899  ORF Transcript_3006/g.4899 Transcript_3006/m.4899 type:complete len:472 (+) Transcript_3006:22-1437(+)